MKHKTYNKKKMPRASRFIFHDRGFTILEMIVALGIFSVVALISTSSLLALTDAQKKSFAIQETYDNLRFAMETISKDIRTGDFFHCGLIPPPLSETNDCVGGATSFTYVNAVGSQITYFLNNGKIEKSIDGVDVGPMTSGDLTIENLTFFVLGSGDGDQIQPMVTIIVRGKSGSGRSLSDFNLQTSVTQRRISQ